MADDNQSARAFNESAAACDRLVTTAAHVAAESGLGPDAICSGGVAALVRVWINSRTAEGQPVTARDVLGAFAKAVNVSAEQVIHGAVPERVN